MASKHQLGIDSLNRFRIIINKLIPFKEDVFSSIVSDDIVKKNNLSIFFPDYEKEIIDTQVKKELK